MKRLVSDYSFDSDERRVTLDVTHAEFKLERLLYILNTRSGEVIYDPSDPNLLAVDWGIDNTQPGLRAYVELSFNTTSQSSTDQLIIIYDDGNLPVAENSDILSRLIGLGQQLVEQLRFHSTMVRTVNGDQIRVTTDSTSVMFFNGGTITTLNQLNGLDSRELLWSQWDTEYNTGVRNKIT
jgi:hypothetical protein